MLGSNVFDFSMPVFDLAMYLAEFTIGQIEDPGFEKLNNLLGDLSEEDIQDKDWVRILINASELNEEVISLALHDLQYGEV